MSDLCISKKMKAEKSAYLFEATPYAAPVLCRGEGSYVWDVDGNRYLDLNAGQFCLSFGHAYKPFAAMVQRQLMTICHTNTSTLSPEVFDAAEKMAATTGYKLTKTIFLSTGSEANECALRYAKFATKRTGVLSIGKGYHGLTLGSQASTMGGQWALPQLGDAVPLVTPDYIHSGFTGTEDEFLEQCMESLEETFERFGESAAALIMEPVIGVGGMVRLPAEYVQAARRLCDRYGVLLIFDECQCGFGRSGNWYVYQSMDVLPDILVTAKAMGAGLAVSAVTFSQKTAEMVEGKLTHFSSHQNDPLSAAVVSFAIGEITEKGLLARNREKGAYLLETLERVCAETDRLCSPRGTGLMCAFDLNEETVGDCRGYSRRFIKRMEENGVLIQAVRQGRTFRIMPNYFVSEEEIDEMAEAIRRSVSDR